MEYNSRVTRAIESFRADLPTFAIVEKGASADPVQSCILMIEGQFYGMGHVPPDLPQDVEEYKAHLTRYPGNDYIRNLIQNYAWRNPHKRVELA